MIAGVMLVLAAAAAAFVLAPLRRTAPTPAGETERAALLRVREAAYQALRDLDLDRATGKIGDADYAALRGRYQARAAAILRRLDALPAPAGDRPAPTRDGGPA